MIKQERIERNVVGSGFHAKILEKAQKYIEKCCEYTYTHTHTYLNKWMQRAHALLQMQKVVHMVLFSILVVGRLIPMHLCFSGLCTCACMFIWEDCST